MTKILDVVFRIRMMIGAVFLLLLLLVQQQINGIDIPTTAAAANNNNNNNNNEIPLWPNEEQVPYERHNVFGNETFTCGNKDCTDRRYYNVTFPTLTPYIIIPSSDTAMIIAPGGAYTHIAFDKEGTDIALWLNSIGISAFILKYRVPGRDWLPFGAAPLMDAQRAMGVVRNLAGSSSTLLPNLNLSKVGFIGFSAGAHLTGHINVAWSSRTYPTIDKADQLSCRPDFSIMVYPWRSVSQPPVNEPISGASAINVTSQTPPTMLVQTQDDFAHVENAIYYYLALKNAGVTPSELHVYPNGGHGYGNCADGKLEVCTWTDRAHAFLTTLGIVKRGGEETVKSSDYLHAMDKDKRESGDE